MESEIVQPAKIAEAVDPIVCFCMRLSEGALKRCYERCGSLEKLKTETRAGTACRGCLSSLTAMFNEQDTWHSGAIGSSTCISPGHSLMKGLLISIDGLETRAVAANSPAPQIKSCDLSSLATYAIVDQEGRPILQAQKPLATNWNFTLDTAELNLPKPFVGQLLYQLDRNNRGSGRLMTRWYSHSGVAATHENGSTGRPRVYCPICIDQRFITGPNRLHIALVNPHSLEVPLTLEVFSRERDVLWRGTGVLGSFGSLWVDAEDAFIRPIREQHQAGWPSAGVFLKVESNDLSRDSCLSCYIFIRNLTTGSWSCQHL